ncbi:MAG: cytidylate kinase-like family protein [Actinomycetota bacterium]
MDRVEKIERYLRAHLAAEGSGGAPGYRPSSHAFVTISRQSGTGAHALAESIVSIFDDQEDSATFGGWRVYDRTICDLVSRDPRFSRSLDALLEEEYRAKSSNMFHQLITASADQGAVMNRAFLVVRAIAGMGKAIIIGRGGSQVTRDMPHGVSMRLVSGKTDRMSAAMKRFNLNEREAKAEIKRRDASRQRMIKDKFGVDISDPREYDVTWNVGSATHAEIAHAVTELVRSRAASG